MMMLDSGAGMTVVDRAYADSIGLKGSRPLEARGASATVPGQLATDVSLAAAGLSLTGMSVLILDMSAVERAIGHKIPVVLGRDAFKAGIVTIDFPRRLILFSSRATFQPPSAAAKVEMRERGRLPAIRIGINGLDPIEADLDLGNGGALLVSHAYWTAQPKLAGLRHAEGQTGGVGGMVRSRRATLPEVELAGIRFTDVPATFNEDPEALPASGANVGIEMFKPFVVTLDIVGGALYLQGTARESSFGRERVGARFELAGDRLRAVYVSPDGPAASAGLKPGDEIVAVEGKRVDGAYYDRPDWTRGPAGKTVSVERADGSRVAIKLTDYY
jgi:membrane-associated protease RseP (regulator of RpoE activity)